MIKKIWILVLVLLPVIVRADSVEVRLKASSDADEVVRLVAVSQAMPLQRRIEFISRYFLGRKYHPDTRQRIKKQHRAVAEKKEAANTSPLPVKQLKTSLSYLDCMTYVEHVLAIAACRRCDYHGEFLGRLIDIMFFADGQPLMNHHRKHFTLVWADGNEQHGYLKNIARHNSMAVKRELVLNRVGNNRTYYVEDRYMISSAPSIQWYFPLDSVLAGRIKLVSGDIVALVTAREGLDVTHMGFYIENDGKCWLRHASSKLNCVVDQDFYGYLRDGRQIEGLMVFRPTVSGRVPASYRFREIRHQ